MKLFLLAIFLLVILINHNEAKPVEAPNLIDILTNKNNFTIDLTRRAFGKLSDHVNDLVENLTNFQNESAGVMKTIMSIRDVLKSTKQSDLPKALNKDQLLNTLSSLIGRNEQLTTIERNFNKFVGTFNEFRRIFSDQRSGRVDDVLKFLIKNALLKPKVDQFQDQNGLSKTFFSDMLGILNPKELKRDWNDLISIGKIAGASGLLKILNDPSVVQVFDMSHNVSIENVSIFDNSNWTENDISSDTENAKPDPEKIVDKLLLYFKNPKFALNDMLNNLKNDSNSSAKSKLADKGDQKPTDPFTELLNLGNFLMNNNMLFSKLNERKPENVKSPLSEYYDNFYAG